VPKSSRPGLRFTSIADLREHLARLDGATVETTGGWDAGQIYYHLSASFEATFAPSRARASRWRRLRKLPLRMYVLRSGLPKGVAIPAAVREKVNPPPDADAAVQFARLLRAIDAFEAAEGDLPAHPVLGPLTRREWRRFHLRHCELHLGHITIARA
jgi:hypothetical protein